MPPRNAYSGRSGLVRALFLCVLIVVVSGWGSTSLGAQDLPLQRDSPGLGPLVCPAPAELVPPAPEARAQASQLASDASQAVILGELLRSQELLLRATQLDPSSFELAYQHARVLEGLGQSALAMDEYCRSIELGVDADEEDVIDARIRLDELYSVMRARIPDVTRESFYSGLTFADAAMYEPAVQAFTTAIDAAPDWPPAIYNRAVVLEQLGRVPESLADYRRYIQLTPGEIDPVVAAVTERIGMLEGLVALPTPSPGGALALGMAFPGMGQYYSGRSLTGTVVLSLAAGAVAAGILYKEVTVHCLTPSAGSCAPEQVIDETSRRPYFWPAIGVAGAVTAAGAIEAFLRARSTRDEVDAARQPVSEARGLTFEGPAVSARRGRIDLALLVMRFR
jgi:tetratricopeptide (TPR) repeat protein